MLASALLCLHNAQYLNDITRWECQPDAPRRAITTRAQDDATANDPAALRWSPLPSLSDTHRLQRTTRPKRRKRIMGKYRRIIFHVSAFRRAKVRRAVPSDCTLSTFG